MLSCCAHGQGSEPGDHRGSSLDQALPYLEYDCEEDHNDGGADKQVLLLDLVLIQKHNQGICHGSTQAAIGHDHLVDGLQLYHAITVQDPGLQDDACSGKCTQLRGFFSMASPQPNPIAFLL